MAEAKVEAETICFSAAVGACEKRQEWQLALGLLSRMAEAKVEAETICYSAAIGACEKRQEWQLALGLLSRMAEAKIVADTICGGAASSACEENHSGNSHRTCSAGWRKQNWMRRPFAIVRQSVHARRDKCGNSQWAC